MKKGVQKWMWGVIVLVILTMTGVLILRAMDNTQIVNTKKVIDPATSNINNSRFVTQCATYCAGYASENSAAQAQAHCKTIICAGKTYSYTCEGSAASCKKTCEDDPTIPDSCHPQCNAPASTVTCKEIICKAQSAPTC